MTYLEWNDHIAKLFFKPENAGKDILIYLTKEDLIPNSIISNLTELSIDEIINCKSQNPKTSDVFRKIFNCGKPEYAYTISDYYFLQPHSPFDRIIKWAVANEKIQSEISLIPVTDDEQF